MKLQKMALATIGVLAVSVAASPVVREIVITETWTALPVPDVTRPSTLRLTYRGLARPSGVVVRVTGHINGESEVWAGNWNRTKLTGDVNWEKYHDWFAFDLDFEYKPVQVSGGHLTVEYRFPH